MHVDFQSLLIENAACFKHAYVPLKDQGLVHVRGVNLDEGGSNGSGKTSLFEMLFYLFYDKLTKSDRKVKKDELINVYSPSDFLLHADIVREGVPYSVEKYRKVKKRGSGVDIWEDGTLITPDDPREAQKALAGLLGRSWNEILGSVYLSQRHTHKMLEGTPAEKKEYMSRYFGLDSLDNMITSTEKRIKAIPLPDETHLAALLEGVEADLQALGDPDQLALGYTTCLESRDDLQEKLVDAKTSLRQQEEAQEILKERKRWGKFLRSSFQLPLDKDEVGSALRERRDTLAKCKVDLSVLRKRETVLEELSSLGDEPLAEDPDELLDELSSSVHQLTSMLPQLRRREELEGRIHSMDSDEDMSKSKLLRRKEKWTLRVSEYAGKLSAVQSELSKLQKVGDKCYACLRDITIEEKQSMIAEREEYLTSLQRALKKSEAALSSYSDRLSSLLKRLTLLERLDDLPTGDASAVASDLSIAKAKYEKLKALQSKFLRIRVLTEKLSDLPDPGKSEDDLQGLLDSSESELSSLEDAFQWILQCGSSLKFDVHSFQRLTSAVSSYSAELDDVNEKLLAIQEKKVRFSSLQKQKNDLTATLSSSSREKTKSQVLRYISITLGELKKLGLRESTKLLSGVLPIYLDQLFPKGDIELSETSDEGGFDLVFNKGGKTLPLTLISGGQAKRVGLAIVFAFAKMGRNSTNLLICDEPFRDLDQNGREACFEVLRDFDIGTLLVTSHDQDLTSSRKYDQTWTVQMKNQISTLYLDS